jgi:hypothetical protein
MEARTEKGRGTGRPRRTWEDCVIDAARRKGKTSADLKRLARERTAFRQQTEDPTQQRQQGSIKKKKKKYLREKRPGGKEVDGTSSESERC